MAVRIAFTAMITVCLVGTFGCGSAEDTEQSGTGEPEPTPAVAPAATTSEPAPEHAEPTVTPEEDVEPSPISAYFELEIPVAEMPEGAAGTLFQASGQGAPLLGFLPEVCESALYFHLSVLQMESVHDSWQEVFRYNNPVSFTPANLAFLDEHFTPFLEASEACAFGAGGGESIFACQGDYSTAGWLPDAPQVAHPVLGDIPEMQFYGNGVFILRGEFLVVGRGVAPDGERRILEWAEQASSGTLANRSVLGQALDPDLPVHLLDSGERLAPVGVILLASERARLVELSGTIPSENVLNLTLHAVFSEASVASATATAFPDVVASNADPHDLRYFEGMVASVGARGPTFTASPSVEVTSMMVGSLLGNAIANRIKWIQESEGEALLLELSQAVGEAFSRGIQLSLPRTPAITPCISRPRATEDSWSENGWELLSFRPSSVRYSYSVTWSDDLESMDHPHVVVAARTRAICSNPAGAENVLLGWVRNGRIQWDTLPLVRSIQPDMPEPTAPQPLDRVPGTTGP